MQAWNWSVAGLGKPLESRRSCCGGWQGLEGRGVAGPRRHRGACTAELCGRGELGFGGGAGVEDGVQERLGWRLKERTGGLGMRAVGHVGEHHGEDRGLC